MLVTRHANRVQAGGALRFETRLRHREVLAGRWCVSRPCRIEEARTAVEKFGFQGHPGRALCAAHRQEVQHTIEIRLITLNVKPAS